MKHALVFASYSMPCLLGCIALASSLSGCAAVSSLTNSISSAANTVAGAFKGPEAEISRPVPAENDLPTIKAIALAPVTGKDAETGKVGKLLADELKSSGRYRVISGDALTALGSEASCDASELDCLAKALPGSALLRAKVVDGAYSERIEKSENTCLDTKSKDKLATKKCIAQVRKGNAKVAFELSLVDAASGKVLVQRHVARSLDQETTSSDSVPDKIDGAELLARARQEAIGEFLAVVSPRHVTVKVPLEEDGDIPELKEGNEALVKGSIGPALQRYQAAVKRADADTQLDPEDRAKAHYCLGVGLTANGEYDAGVRSLQKAQTLYKDEDWATLTSSIQTWKADADRHGKQLALAKAAEAPSPTEPEATTPSAANAATTTP
jgi:curli biogenesis system outer membrane secretion channel CsgG